MTRVGQLKKRDADRSRYKAKHKSQGRKNAKSNPTFKLDLTPPQCECGEKAWSDGDGGCHRCGKTL